MKLQGVGSVAIAERLIGIGVSPRQRNRAIRQIKSFPVPLINHLRPVEQGLAFRCGVERVIADLHLALWMRLNISSQVAHQFLCTETDSQKRSVFLKRHGEPVGFPFDKFITVIGAHRAAEHDGTGMVIEAFRQGIAQGWAADIEFETTFTQSHSDASGCRCFLM